MDTHRYLALVLIAFAPSLSGCLGHYALKADVDYDGSSDSESKEETSEEKDQKEMRL